MGFSSIKEYQHFVKGVARESAELKSKVTNEYIRLYKQLPNPKDDTELRASLCDRFLITPKRLQKILDNQSNYLNAQQQSFTSGLVMGHYLAGVQAAQDAIHALDEYDDYVDKKIDADEKWIEIEKYTGAKGDGIKAVTPREAKRGILRERLDIFIKSFEPLKALAPKIIQVQGDGLRFDTMAELEEQEKIEMERLKISKGEKDEEN